MIHTANVWIWCQHPYQIQLHVSSIHKDSFFKIHFTGAELYTKGFSLNSGKSENNGTVYLKLRCIDAVGSYSDLPMETKVRQWIYSHTFLTDNHVRLHSFQNASYTGDVCDLHLRLTAKPHICVICGTFHTEVNTHLLLCSTHNLLIKRSKGLNLCIQVERFSPCDRSDCISISGNEAPPTYWLF